MYIFTNFFWGMRGAEKEGKRDSQAGSMPKAEPDAGLDLPTLSSWPAAKSKVGCSTD